MANVIAVRWPDATYKQIWFGVSGSFSPVSAKSNLTIGTPTEVVMALAGLAATPAGYASAKFGFPDPRPQAYEVLGCVDFTGEAPDDDGAVDYYWLSSTSSTAAQGNICGTDGATGLAPSNPLGSATLADLIEMSKGYIGSLAIHNGVSVQNGVVNRRWSPPSRYGQLLVVNNAGDVFEDDNVEHHQVFNPIIDEIQ